MSIASVSGPTSAALAQQLQQQTQLDAASQAGTQQVSKVHPRHQHDAAAQTPAAAPPQASASSARPASRLDVTA